MKYLFPCGRTLVQLGPDTYRLDGLDGKTISYLRAEHIDYATVRPPR